MTMLDILKEIGNQFLSFSKCSTNTIKNLPISALQLQVATDYTDKKRHEPEKPLELVVVTRVELKVNKNGIPFILLK